MEDRLNDEEDSRKELEAALAEKKQQISDLEKKLEGDVLGKAKELEISERRLRAQLEEVQLKLDEVRTRAAGCRTGHQRSQTLWLAVRLRLRSGG